MGQEIMWWGYRHINGTIHAKRWFNDPLDIQEAAESDFVDATAGPFEAACREQAMEILVDRLGEDNA